MNRIDKDEKITEIYRDQVVKCLPLIELERCAFIKKEHGRLQALIGVRCFSKKTGREGVFHREIIVDTDSDLRSDPYDIPLEDLAALPDLEVQIEKLNTYNYLPLFNMLPEDKERIGLLTRMWRKLTHMTVCSEHEVDRLISGHPKYMDSKTNNSVKVIIPEVKI